MMKKHRFAEAVIERGVIVIRLPIKSLPMAVQYGPEAEGTRVTNSLSFAKDVVTCLNSGDELGTTPIHRMFDAAFVQAIEDGSMAVDVAGEDK
jgi:hypothetical protein